MSDFSPDQVAQSVARVLDSHKVRYTTKRYLAVIEMTLDSQTCC
jgi:hypothetical protein